MKKINLIFFCFNWKKCVYVTNDIKVLYYTTKYCHINSILTVYYQNPPAFWIQPIKIHARSKSIRFFLFFYQIILYIFCIFFTFYLFFFVNITPNPYFWSVSSSRIWLGEFWTRVNFERVLFYILQLLKY